LRDLDDYGAGGRLGAELGGDRWIERDEADPEK